MASPKETGEGIDFVTQEHVTSSTGIGCAIIASGIPVYFIFVTEYPLKKPAPIRRFLGHRMQFGKNHLFSPSQHNNRVAEAVCGGDAAEKIGLKFSKDCTTWSRCTRWQIILTWINLPISGKNSVSQTWHENLSSFQGCFPTNSPSKPSNIKLVNCRTYQWQTHI